MKFKLVIDEKAEDEITVTASAPSVLTQRIEELVNEFSGVDGVICYRDDEMRKLEFSQIEFITIFDRKVFVIDRDGNRYRTYERLCALEQVLPSYFIRINKSTIANERRILRFDTVFSGGVDAVFKCGEREYVSRRCFTEIRRRYERV